MLERSEKVNKLSVAKRGLLALAMVGFLLQAADKPITLKPTELNKQDLSLVVRTMLKLHFSEHEMSPALVERIFNQFVERLDPFKVFYTKTEAFTASNFSNRYANEIGEQFLKGDYRTVTAHIQRFKVITDRLEKFFTELESKTDRIKEIAKAKPKVSSERADGPVEREERILTWIATMYASGTEYLTEEDAMKMACHAARKAYGKWRAAITQEQELTFFLKCYSNALDPHSNYFEPNDQATSRLNASFAGIGVSLKPSFFGAFVDKVMEGGSAAASGQFDTGDQIVGVDGTDVTGLELDEIVAKVKGEIGTEVVIRLLKAKTKQAVDVKLRRVRIMAVQSAMKTSIIKTAQGPIGVLMVDSFYEGMANDARKSIEAMKKDGIVGIVLDLRNNGGGLLDEAVALAGLFVPEGPIVGTWDGRKDPLWYSLDKHAVTYAGPLVVLVNQGSASASELISGVFQDLGRAIIVGPTKTFGKGSVQGGSLLLNLFVPGSIMMTMQLYFLPSGGSVQSTGVIPDVMIPGAKLDETALETHYQNVIPATSIKSGVTEGNNPDMKHWRKWRSAHLKEMAERSTARTGSNEAYKAAFADGAIRKEGDTDFQANEAAAIAGEMSKDWE